MNIEKFFSVGLNSISTTGRGSLPAVSLLSSLLLNLNDAVKGLLPSNISMNGMDKNWYMALSPFETFFVGFIIFMIFVFRYIEILPINLNNWMHGDPSGRKKRSIYANGNSTSIPSSFQSSNCLDKLSESAFELIIKLDQEECFRKSICILSTGPPNISISSKKFVDRTIGTFKRLSKLRKLCTEQSSKNGFDMIEEALHSVGRQYTQTHQNVVTSQSQSLCAKKYSLCPSTELEILDYLNIIFTLLKDL